MIQKIINYIINIKDTIKKKRIIRLAIKAGCDIDGDIYYYNGEPYFVYIMKDIVEKCKKE